MTTTTTTKRKISLSVCQMFPLFLTSISCRKWILTAWRRRERVFDVNNFSAAERERELLLEFVLTWEYSSDCRTILVEIWLQEIRMFLEYLCLRRRKKGKSCFSPTKTCAVGVRWTKRNSMSFLSSAIRLNLEAMLFLPDPLLPLLIGRVNAGGRWTLDDDDFVALRIAAGTSPSVYLAETESDGSANALAMPVDEAASEDGLDWLCCGTAAGWWCWSFNRRIKHHSGALGGDLWTRRTCWPLLTVNSWALRAV